MKEVHKRSLEQKSLVGALISCAFTYRFSFSACRSLVMSKTETLFISVQWNGAKVQKQHMESCSNMPPYKLFAWRRIGGCLNGTFQILESNSFLLILSVVRINPLYEWDWHLICFFSLCIRSKHFEKRHKNSYRVSCAAVK